MSRCPALWEGLQTSQSRAGVVWACRTPGQRRLMKPPPVGLTQWHAVSPVVAIILFTHQGSVPGDMQLMGVSPQ